jgi:16S rRNA processing protein RimM
MYIFAPMETIAKNDCEKIGYFRKTHGVRGDLVLDFESHFECSIAEAERFFVDLEGLLVPFFISENGLRLTTSKSAIITFDWVDTEKYAKRLVGCSVYLYVSEITDEAQEDESTFEGYLLLDEQLGEIGMINQVDDYAGNIVLTVNYRGNELLVPFNEDILIAVNESLKTITLKLPEGIFDE